MEKENKTPKKRPYTLKKNKDKFTEEKNNLNDDINDWVMKQGEVIQNVIKTPKQVGYYKVGKSFNIFFERKPNFIHRFFSKLLLGWTWFNK